MALPPEGLAPSAWEEIREAHEAGRHGMVLQANGNFTARNPAQHWKATFDGRGFTVNPDSGAWE